VPENQEIKNSIDYYMGMENEFVWFVIDRLNASIFNLYYLEQSLKGLDKILGTIDVDLDGRFSVVRSCESNLGNFICDIILQVNIFLVFVG
jgi:hypothetical protein